MAPTISPTTPTRTSINIPFQRQTTPPRSYVSNKRTSTSNDPSPIEPATTPTYTTSSRNPLRNGFDRAPDTQEDDGKVKRSLQIDMKSMVGDSVGNMSISPSERHIVLAARKGLFIVDLDAPTEVPEFYPQGGTWDVVEAQWNPHSSHEGYIVTTSSDRMLIWNLYLQGKNNIEFILQAHYRAITDINWHPIDWYMICSTSIDAWIWAWDIRTTQKPVFGISAFNAGGTQVKWNRKDANILASSHLDEVLIWDRRKGSVPVYRIKAHDGKIYGIDWSHTRSNEIITCSLDKTIKVWDTKSLNSSLDPYAPLPSQVFYSEHPVWRARDLPFGNGMLSLPQRGESVPQMWNYDYHRAPVENFEGHSDVVKEFVWRTKDVGGPNVYSLMTWSKDKSLRFWSVGRDTLQKVGVSRESLQAERKSCPRPREGSVSFRSQQTDTSGQPTLSAPRGNRTLLAGIRATPVTNPVLLPHAGSNARGMRSDLARERDPTVTASGYNGPESVNTRLFSVFDRRDGTMTKGNARGDRTRVDNTTWLQNVRTDSVGPSRYSSGSRPSSVLGRNTPNLESGARRSTSRSRPEDTSRESENALLDEINAVVNKLTPAKFKVEKHNLNNQNRLRNCTFGLHGPWGESKTVNVFVRVTFIFPRDYPTAKNSKDTPLVEIERSPLISVKRRAYMIKRLREIREKQRPCLEACLRFLLFGDGTGKGQKLRYDSGSSSDEEEPVEMEKGKDFSASLIRDHPNLAEPRSSQGVFGPNGQLVCIFRSIPRLVKAVPQDLSATPAIPSRETDGVPRIFRSPLQLSDAVRRLAIAANDHNYDFLDSRESEDMENVLRIMNNLLSFSNPKARGYSSETPSVRGTPGIDAAQGNLNYSLSLKRMTVVYIKDKSAVVGVHRKLATEYTFDTEGPLDYCDQNANIARRYLRSDHERIFKTVAELFKGPENFKKRPSNPDSRNSRLKSKIVIDVLHSRLVDLKDVQLLAMFAVAALQLLKQILNTVIPGSTPESGMPIARDPFSRITPSTDHFSLSMRMRRTGQLSTPFISRGTEAPSSPTTPIVGPDLASSTSSRGSWSSLFHSGQVRGLVRSSGDSEGHLDTPISGKDENKSTSAEKSTTPFPKISEAQEKKIFYESPAYKECQFTTQTQKLSKLLPQLLSHIHAYAEILHSWNLIQKRTEMYKAIKTPDPYLSTPSPQGELGIMQMCQRCSKTLNRQKKCLSCVHLVQRFPFCIICRMPVKGISYNCIVCSHTSHLRCWKKASGFRFCPSGCGCECTDGIAKN